MTGIARFGLSGDGDIPLNFLFSSGKIFDPNGNQVYSYSSGDAVSISTTLGSLNLSFIGMVANHVLYGLSGRVVFLNDSLLIIHVLKKKRGGV